MIYLDAALLHVTESFCHWFQRLTGRTNVWLAVQLTNLSIIVYFVGAGVYIWDSNVGVRIALGLFCGGLLYVLVQTVFRVPIETYENNVYRRVAKGIRNPRRVRDVLLRISFLTLSLVLFYPLLFVYLNLRLPFPILLSYSLIVLTTLVLYLLACDPLPPSAGRMRAWLEESLPSKLSPEKGAVVVDPSATTRAAPRTSGQVAWRRRAGAHFRDRRRAVRRVT